MENKPENEETENINEKNELIPMDEMFVVEKKRQERKLMAYIPSFFTTASLPFRNVNSPVFIRKGSNGITLNLQLPKMFRLENTVVFCCPFLQLMRFFPRIRIVP